MREQYVLLKKNVKQALKNAFPEFVFCYHDHLCEATFSFWSSAHNGAIDAAEFRFNEQGEFFLPEDGALISDKDRAWHEDMIARFNAVINHE
jgi:hypothetical protein